MSQSIASTTTDINASKIIKNKYFTYTGSLHREQRQVWNVGDITIYVQGSEPGSRIETFFAKKHLLTFAGGKADKAGLEDSSKMADILAKRRNGANKKKYGAVLEGSTNTFIICDYLSAEQLKKSFANGLKAALLNTKGEKKKIKGYATTRVDFPKPCVVTLYHDGFSDESSACEIGFEKVPGGNVFVVTHMEGQL